MEILGGTVHYDDLMIKGIISNGVQSVYGNGVAGSPLRIIFQIPGEQAGFPVRIGQSTVQGYLQDLHSNGTAGRF